jgi:hypothetical protein
MSDHPNLRLNNLKVPLLYAKGAEPPLPPQLIHHPGRDQPPFNHLLYCRFLWLGYYPLVRDADLELVMTSQSAILTSDSNQGI